MLNWDVSGLDRLTKQVHLTPLPQDRKNIDFGLGFELYKASIKKFDPYSNWPVCDIKSWRLIVNFLVGTVSVQHHCNWEVTLALARLHQECDFYDVVNLWDEIAVVVAGVWG